MTNVPLVLFLGLIFTLQNHLAKALERQGIEVFAQIKARLHKSGAPVEGGVKKPLIYTIGLVLNNTLFIWSVLAQPHGPPALFTSVYGMGLVFLMIYAAVVMKERLRAMEAWGAGLIVTGSLLIGLENLSRQGVDRFSMNLEGMFAALVLLVAAGLAGLILAGRAGSPGRSGRLNLTGLAFGAFAGSLGGLDPFLKGVGQNHGGDPSLIPHSLIGMVIFLASFGVGFLAFLITQVGFAKGARASILVPAYNATYVGLPVVLQSILLPGYGVYASTLLSLGLVIGGMVLMTGAGRRQG